MPSEGDDGIRLRECGPDEGEQIAGRVKCYGGSSGGSPEAALGLAADRELLHSRNIFDKPSLLLPYIFKCLTMSSSDSDSIIDGSPEPVQDSSKKRKRTLAPSEDELEIDVNLPEPPSKKAKRLELKKQKREEKKAAREANKGDAKDASSSTHSNKAEPTAANVPAKRTDFSIWIGNLPWTATKESLRQFLDDQANITDKDITRVHMPAPAPDKNDTRRIKPQNKGFAYVDFTSKSILDSALELSEQLLGGRRVLIKNAKSFEGRPDKPKSETEAAGTKAGGGKPPARRIFVGNLDFAITQEDLYEHFGQAGEVEDVHIATFEDSGKCRGFGWVRFVEVESAEAAVKGFIYKKKDDEEGEEEEEDAKEKEDESEDAEKKTKSKRREKKRQKWFINRLHGRELRCEFAEDSSVRYKKRFGKEAKPQRASTDGGAAEESVESLAQQAAAARQQKRDRPQKRFDRPQKKFDARNVAPAKALANAPRSSAAIVQGSGKKLKFDE